MQPIIEFTTPGEPPAQLATFGCGHWTRDQALRFIEQLLTGVWHAVPAPDDDFLVCFRCEGPAPQSVVIKEKRNRSVHLN